jgi:hypothetical protein
LSCFGLCLSFSLSHPESHTRLSILKPFHPQTAGLWLLHDATGDSEFSFRAVPAGRDLLGWWIVPLGLLAGCALAVPIIAHGISDTIDFLLIFLGRYPGM